ncbi:hypothetical protein [Profundibacterium mesophilum]|uniref:hypothetical protein n=1 Tax=Profundibacterium mesophilum TaxID=1258573 RepID=UPI0013592E9A|nr:hypothetical protein [Profundibacterium mesophilum]
MKPLLVTLFMLVASTGYAFDDKAIVSQCDEKWGNDFQMATYCRDQQRSAAGVVDQFRLQAESSETLRTIIIGCDSKWVKDYRMVEYCIEQQVSASNSLDTPVDDVPDQISGTILATCREKWGNDYRMVAYCQDQQIQAWRSLQ